MKLFGKRSNTLSAPIRILMGYLAGVSKRDASEFARSMAERYCSQLEIVNVGIYAYADGFVYEIQEGGDGRGYFPSILRKAQRENSQELSAILKSGERLVKIVLKPGALQCLLLPTETDAQPEPIEPTGSMSPLENLGYGFLLAASILFVSGFSALLVTGLLFRYAPPQPPAPIPPHQQTALEYWNHSGHFLYEKMPPSQYLASMHYINGAWGLSFGAIPDKQAKVSVPGKPPYPPIAPGARNPLAGARPNTPAGRVGLPVRKPLTPAQTFVHKGGRP